MSFIFYNSYFFFFDILLLYFSEIRFHTFYLFAYGSIETFRGNSITMTRPFPIKINTGDYHKLIVGGRDYYPYVLLLIAVTFESKGVIAFRASATFGIIDFSFFNYFLYFFHSNIPAVHSASYMFGKNQVGCIPVSVFICGDIIGLLIPPDSFYY